MASMMTSSSHAASSVRCGSKRAMMRGLEAKMTRTPGPRLGIVQTKAQGALGPCAPYWASAAAPVGRRSLALQGTTGKGGGRARGVRVQR